jgi:hypothetical protein
MGDLPLFDPFKALDEVRRECGSELPQKLPQPLAGAIHEQDQKLNPTSAASAASAGVPSVRELAGARVKEEERKENLIISYTYARPEPAHSLATASTHIEAAEAAEAAEVLLSHSKGSCFAENSAAEVLDGELRKWRFGLSRLSADQVPCPGYTPTGWVSVYGRALEFLDTFGPQAETLGWTAARLFGVHPQLGVVRVDACGALVLPTGSGVRAITATEVALGHLTYREKPGQPAGIPLWEFGR